MSVLARPLKPLARTDRERRLADRLRHAEQRVESLTAALEGADEEIHQRDELLSRLGVAALLPAIAGGDGDALAVAREILATIRSWNRKGRVIDRLAGQVAAAQRALPGLEAAASAGNRRQLAAALQPLVRALGEP